MGIEVLTAGNDHLIAAAHHEKPPGLLEHIHRQHPTGVVAHHQRAPGRHVVEPAYFRSEVALEEGAGDAHDALREPGIPHGDLR
jgi:hypothetical protein